MDGVKLANVDAMIQHQNGESYKPPEQGIEIDSECKQLALDVLPNALLLKIFVFAGPNNNLPLVSKYFNRVLKFDPDNCNDGEWKNFALVTAMVKEHYAVSFNDKLDFELIDKKLIYYKQVLHQYTEKTGKYLMDFDYHLIELSKNIQSFKSCCIGLDTNVLTNKFISKLSIREIVSWFENNSSKSCYNNDIVNDRLSYGDTSSHPNAALLPHDTLVTESTRRFYYIVLAFKACSYYVNRMENPSEQYTAIPRQELIHMSEKAINEFPLTSIDTNAFRNWANNCYPGNLDFVTFQHPHRQPRYIPCQVYRKGIDSNHRFELLETLLTKFDLRIEFIDEMLIKTFSHFTPDNFQGLNYSELCLNKFVLPFRSPCLRNDREFMPTQSPSDAISLPPIIYQHFPDLQQILQQSTIVDILRMYDIYSKIEVGQFAVNCRGENIFEDVSLTTKLLLAEYFRNRDVNCVEIWKYVIKSKNNSLQQIVYHFKTPPKILMKEYHKAFETTCSIV